MAEIRTVSSDNEIVDEAAVLREIGQLQLRTMLANARNNAAMASANSSGFRVPRWLVALLVAMTGVICFLCGMLVELLLHR